MFCWFVPPIILCKFLIYDTITTISMCTTSALKDTVRGQRPKKAKVYLCEKTITLFTDKFGLRIGISTDMC